MWELNDLIRHARDNKTKTSSGQYIPARPLNGTITYAGLMQRLKDAWKVFRCEAEAFIWPEECSKCGQVDFDQCGEYPCSKCGLSTVWDQ